jgi:hypothetical protein
MNVSSRLLLPLAGAVVLVGAVLGVVLWPAPSTPPLALPPSPAVTVPVSQEPASRPPAPAPRPPAPSSVAAPAPTPEAPTPEAPPSATEVPIGPGDEVPEPESSNPLPQENDPIEPEKPQTVRWRLGKTERITTLLTRDVARLEHERAVAEASGNEQERQRLDTLIRRHEERLSKLREELIKLSDEAQREPPEQ